MNASIVASGVGSIYVIGVENSAAVNLAGTASVTIGAESGESVGPGVMPEPSFLCIPFWYCTRMSFWTSICFRRPQQVTCTKVLAVPTTHPPTRAVCKTMGPLRVSKHSRCSAENVTITGQATGVNTVNYDLGTCTVSVRLSLNSPAKSQIKYKTAGIAGSLPVIPTFYALPQAALG